VKSNGSWGYFNTSGKRQFKTVFDLAGKFSEGLAMVKVGDSCGYINKSSNIVIRPQF
jgi:hypothetical protein